MRIIYNGTVIPIRRYTESCTTVNWTQHVTQNPIRTPNPIHHYTEFCPMAHRIMSDVTVNPITILHRILLQRYSCSKICTIILRVFVVVINDNFYYLKSFFIKMKSWKLCTITDEFRAITRPSLYACAVNRKLYIFLIIRKFIVCYYFYAAIYIYNPYFDLKPRRYYISILVGSSNIVTTANKPRMYNKPLMYYISILVRYNSIAAAACKYNSSFYTYLSGLIRTP